MADRSDFEAATAGPPPVVDLTVPPGSDERAESVWRLKERIRSRDGLLVQRRPFFDVQYRQSTCYLAVTAGSRATTAGGTTNRRDRTRRTDRDPVGDVVGFALVRPDGYLSLLGVAPAHRRRGMGSRLLARVVDDHPDVRCHVRATNGDAIGFYASRGFLVDGQTEGYYRDGTDAYRMVRDAERAERLADVLT